MKTELEHTIRTLLLETRQFNANDVLVNCLSDSIVTLKSEAELAEPFPREKVKKIVSFASKVQKESGIFPLCYARLAFKWNYKNSEILTPLFLTPLEVTLNKVTQEFTFQMDADDCFINPFIHQVFKDEWELELPSDINSYETIDSFIQLNKLPISIQSFFAIGNFHHHRYELVKELEALLQQEPSASIASLFGEAITEEPEKLDLPDGLLFPADVDQLAVFDQISIDNCVVQGPPGTGKSQVLGTLIGKLVGQEKQLLVVSEKRVALEVLQKKLQQFKLDQLCFIASSEIVSKEFIVSLKQEWIDLEQQTHTNAPIFVADSSQKINQLNYFLDLLNHPTLIGGISYDQFQQVAKNSSFEQAIFDSNLPAVDEWILYEEIVKELYENDLAFYVGSTSFPVFRNAIFFQLDTKVRAWILTLKKLQEIFEIQTWSDVQFALKKAALCQNFSNPFFRKFEAILTHNSKEQKSFLRLQKKWNKLHKECSVLEKNSPNWKQTPNFSMGESLLLMLKKSSIFSRIKAKKMWATYSVFPIDQAKELLQLQQLINAKKNEIAQLTIEFCEIGVNYPESEIDQLAHQLHLYSDFETNIRVKLSHEEQEKFAAYNSTLNSFYSDLKVHFNFDDVDRLLPFLEQFLLKFEDLCKYKKELQNWNTTILKALKSRSNFAQLKTDILKSSWTKFTFQFPNFSHFQVQDLVKLSAEICEIQAHEAEQFAQIILSKRAKKFAAFHTLLQTQTSQLSLAQKAQKKRLKNGKSQLIKLFARSKNFPSLRELFASDALEWIQLLKPIWLSNPVQVAKCFPLQKELFDVAIFDEASQIPLANALGTIQRSKRILIAGDAHQMGPHTFFKTQSEDLVSVLHQASFHWKNVALHHHYRSEHPGLIQFSNQHFYHNQLIAFPTYEQEKQPIQWHYLPEGRFIERENTIEAQAVAQQISTLIDSSETIGIVAFSETQLAAIYRHLSPDIQLKLADRIESNTLFFKALENVQGEECDRLIISFGYARNEAGEFALRFGPINSKNGTKRLNVLLTRARKKIHFFSSVNAADFKLSSNEAIRLLRLFFLQLETIQQTQSPVFPFQLAPRIEDSKLYFDKAYTKLHKGEELITFVRVLTSRSWQLNFT